jgi:hypothetical protein
MPGHLSTFAAVPAFAALQTWRHLQRSMQQRCQAALAARCRLELGQLRSCLHAWQSQCCRHVQLDQLLRKAQATLPRGLLRRCWREWRAQCGLRWWKVQLVLRDDQLQLLGSQVSFSHCMSDRLWFSQVQNKWICHSK